MSIISVITNSSIKNRFLCALLFSFVLSISLKEAIFPTMTFICLILADSAFFLVKDSKNTDWKKSLFLKFMVAATAYVMLTAYCLYAYNLNLKNSAIVFGYVFAIVSLMIFPLCFILILQNYFSALNKKMLAKAGLKKLDLRVGIPIMIAAALMVIIFYLHIDKWL